MTISDQMVDVAARAIVASLPNDADYEMHRGWAIGYARAALEAAAPFIRAECLDGAAEAIAPQSGIAYPHAFGVCVWLRARAAAERGGE